MNEQQVWTNLLVERLRTEHKVEGEAFAEVGHHLIAQIHQPLEGVYCPCGCTPVQEGPMSRNP